jgi:branched-chain amino acid transport system permease protein
MVLAVVILLGLLVARLRRGPAGRMLLAIRSNERAAGSVGINVAQGKLMAFGLAAFIAGIGGALTGYLQGDLTADSFVTFLNIHLSIGKYQAIVAGLALEKLRTRATDRYRKRLAGPAPSRRFRGRRV